MTLIITHKKDHVCIDCTCSLANSFDCVGDSDTCYLSMNYLKGRDKPNYPMPALQRTNWSDWFDNSDGYWNTSIEERLWRLERTLWATEN